jgi:tetratricopeptide (TPR) repeat protein
MIFNVWMRFAVALCVAVNCSAQQQASSQDVTAEVQQHEAKVENALRANDLPTAEQEYRAIVALDPANSRAWTGLGVLLYGKGDAAGASTALASAIKINPREDRADLFLGLSEADLGHCNEAIPILDRHFDSVPAGKLQRLTGLALLDCTPTTPDAMPAFKIAARLKSLYPDDPDVLYKCAELDTRMWNQDANQLMTKHPDSYRVHQLAGEVYEAQGNIDQAIREYKLALDENPRMPQMHFRIGQLYLRKGDPDADQKAMEEFEAETKADAGSAVSALAMAEIYQYRHDVDHALTEYRRAANLDPALVEAQIGLAKVLLAKHQVDASIEELRRVISEHPDNAQAHYVLMLDYREVGKMQEASQEMETFRKLQESDSQRFDSRLNVLLNNKDHANDSQPK